MVLVNFKVVMGADDGDPGWLRFLSGLLDGRAAAAFVILAGIGASLMTARAREEGDGAGLDTARTVLLKRALFLLIAGYLFVPIWPADILHYYAFYIGIGALVLRVPGPALWGLAAAAAATFVGLYTVAEYWLELDIVRLTYAGFWTPVGLVRNLVFNGWHPVLPWVAFYLVGMWLGRRDLLDRMVRRRLLLGAVAVAVLAELVAWRVGPIEFDVVERSSAYLGVEAGPRALLAAEPLPPGPVYLAAAGGTAVAVILLCVGLAARFPDARLVRWPAAAGELAMTIYFAHVLLGMGALEAIGRLDAQTLPFATISALVFSAASVAFAVWWRRYRRRGPVEWLMRRLT
jgi:uncharacterized membrane protein YeiB